MFRRTYILALGSSIGLAGCMEGGSNTGEDTGPTPTSTPRSETTSLSATQTSEGTTESSTDTPESTPTETETQTPNTPSEVESLIETARDSLSEAVAVYAEFAPRNRDGIISITAKTTDFSASDVFQPANSALRSLNDAEERDNLDEYAEEIATLRSVHSFIIGAARTRQSLVDAYVELLEIRTLIEDQSYDEVPNLASSIGSEQESASTTFQELLDGSSPGDMDAVENISPEIYEEMVAVFRPEIAAFGVLESALPTLSRRLESFEEAMEEYEDDDDDFGRFPDFVTVVNELNDCPRPDALAPHVDYFSCMAEKYAEASEFMGDAVAAKEDGNDSTEERHKDEADEVLQTGC
jgi:hypothetical protein